jgi:capsular exopolysaccharide synthesis family protein
VEDLVSNAPEIVELEARIAAGRKSLAALNRATQHYQRVERVMQETEVQLGEARQRLREKLVEEQGDRQAEAERDRLNNMKGLLTKHQLMESILRARLDEERRKIENQTGNQYELEFLMSDLARAKRVADRIDDRIFGLRIEYLSPHRPEQVKVLYPAETPRAPIEAFPLKSMAMAGFAGLMLPFAAFVAFELLSRRLYQSNQLQDRSRLMLLAEIAVLPSRPRFSSRGALRRYRKDRAVFEESVESLRSVLSVSPDWANAQVLAITSAVSGEGKTSLASQLATGWARHGGTKTLIIDGDVRDPDVYAIFGIANSPGLVDVLRHECEQDRAIIQWESQLDILPAGTLMADPHRLFAGNEFAQLIERLRMRYDRIIVDVAPLLSASEVLGMLKSVDGVLLCARKDHSRAPQVRLARERLERAGIDRVGGVFGGLPSSSYAYQYGDQLA